MPKEHNEQRGPDDCLAHAVVQLAHAITQLGRELANQTILQRIEQKVDTMATAIADFAAKQAAFNTRQGAAIDAAVASVTGLTEDVAELNRKITELQNSQGGVTPEDQTLINDLETQGDAVATRLEAVATALSNLDAQNPPTVPSVP